MDWVEAVMAKVDDVDWGSLRHAYGSAELVPLALRAWLSGDSRVPASIDPGDDEFTFFDYAGGESVGHAALNWVYVAVFHQGTMYSASAPTCRVLLETFQQAPHEIVRLEALQALFFVASAADPNPADFTDEWRLDSFQAASFQDRATIDELNAGAAVMRSAIGRHESHDIRDLGVLMLAWMTDRAASADSIIEVLLSGEPDEGLSPPAFQAEAQSRELALRVLGLVARGTESEEAAERTARLFVNKPGQVGLGACVALARLRRIREHDAALVARLQQAYAEEYERRDRWGALLGQRTRAQEARDWTEHARLDAEVKALTRNDERESMYLDALISIALYCMLHWRPEIDPVDEAKSIVDRRLSLLADEPVEGASHFEEAWFMTNRRNLEQRIVNVYRHHRIDHKLRS